ncbi:MAG TPA: hypothetical protein VJZ06_04935 [Mobilitalea sp.]|nr:hypothetical protein [Mobilitalea sp.]
MNNPTVTIFAENKQYPANKGFESFTFHPILILDGTVTNMREPRKKEVVKKC